MAENRYHDWFKQAENDWEWGNHTLDSGFYAQACFVSQQIAKKALKSLCLFRKLDNVHTYSVSKITQELGINGEIEEMGKYLDLYYIPTRYPIPSRKGLRLNPSPNNRQKMLSIKHSLF